MQFARFGSLSWPPAGSLLVVSGTGLTVLFTGLLRTYSGVRRAKNPRGEFKCLIYIAAHPSRTFLREIRSRIALMNFIKIAAAATVGTWRIGLPLKTNCGIKMHPARRSLLRQIHQTKQRELHSRVRNSRNRRRLQLHLRRSKTRIPSTTKTAHENFRRRLQGRREVPVTTLSAEGAPPPAQFPVAAARNLPTGLPQSESAWASMSG